MHLKSNELELKGSWIAKDNVIVEDATSKRINFLIQNFLIKITASNSGWDILYLDTQDNRYWELIYNNSEQHGAGAPSLRYISKEQAKKKYGV